MSLSTAAYFDSVRNVEHALRHLLPSLTDADGLPSSVRDMAERLGLPAALRLVEKLGGVTIPVPMRATSVGEARYRRLAGILGAELAATLCRMYPGADLYVPNCKRLLLEARDAALTRDRDALAREGYSERDLVAVLALRYGVSDRHVWRVLKRPARRLPPTGQCPLL